VIKSRSFLLLTCVLLLSLFACLLLEIGATNVFADEERTYPSILVVVDDYANAIKQKNYRGQEVIEEYFLANNFPVVNRGRQDAIETKGITLYYADPKKSAEIAKHYNADMIIVGRTISNFNDMGEPENRDPFNYNARSDVKPISSSNAEVLGVGNLIAAADDRERDRASEKATEKVALKTAKFCLARIAEAWRKEIYGSIAIRLILLNATPENIVSLENVLNPLREVRASRRVSLKDNTLLLELRYFGTAEQLAKTLSNTNEPIIEVLNLKPNKIEIRIQE